MDLPKYFITVGSSTDGDPAVVLLFHPDSKVTDAYGKNGPGIGLPAEEAELLALQLMECVAKIRRVN